jgi:hypothetical protein
MIGVCAVLVVVVVAISDELAHRAAMRCDLWSRE